MRLDEHGKGAPVTGSISLGQYLSTVEEQQTPKTYPLGGFLKRAFDVSFAITAALILLPIIILTALVIRITLGGPVLYRHRRIGFGGAEFDCLKFRTMITNGDDILQRHFQLFPDAQREWNETRKLVNDPRVTQLGAVLRKTSLDELPQLLNILRGDMSVVGPRPIVREELARYGAASSCYLQARPGLTGAWQISGRSDTTYGERVAFDTHYVNEWSMLSDVWIVIRTVPVVMLTKGSR